MEFYQTLVCDGFLSGEESLLTEGLDMNRNFRKLFFLTSLILTTHCFALQDASFYTQSKESLKNLTPDMALELLKEGNQRFTAGKMKNRNYLQQVKLTSKKQYPFAFILSCMDSRGSSELLFDQGIGDIFVGRVAGNVINDDMLGSMEFATQVMGSHLIVVMGHTSCGAMKGACEKVNMGNLTQLLNKISPAVNTVHHSHAKPLNCEDAKIVDAIAQQNVLNMIQEIEKRSPLIKKSMDNKEVMIVGAMQDLKTGRISFE